MKKVLLLLLAAMLMFSVVIFTGCDEEAADDETNPAELRYNMLYDYLQDEYVFEYDNSDSFLEKIKLIDDPKWRNLTLEANPYKDISGVTHVVQVPDADSGAPILAEKRIIHYDSDKRTDSLHFIDYDTATTAITNESYFQFKDFSESSYTSKVSVSDASLAEVYNGKAEYKLINGMWLITKIELNITGQTNDDLDDYATWEISYNSNGYITKYMYNDEKNDVYYLFSLSYNSGKNLSEIKTQKGTSSADLTTIQDDNFTEFNDDGKPGKRIVQNGNFDKIQEDVYTYDTNGDLYEIKKTSFNLTDGTSSVTISKAELGDSGCPETITTYNGSVADANKSAKEVYEFNSTNMLKEYTVFTYTNGTNETEVEAHTFEY